ncbi:hypothetical protein ACN2AV_12620 [Lentilactobacillus buchneri subsp. silagei]|uniref:hypothetical protein n=1 Tax=Lentilactobacillus buchneri TaxID=1581 RepID=UPI003AFA801B
MSEDQKNMFWFLYKDTVINIVKLLVISIVLMVICHYFIKYFLNGYRNHRLRRLFLTKPFLREQDETMWSLSGISTLFYFSTMLIVFVTIQLWEPMVKFLPTPFAFNPDDVILYATISYSVFIGGSMFSFYKLMTFFIKPQKITFVNKENIRFKRERDHKIHILKRIQSLGEVAFSLLTVILLICSIIGNQLKPVQNTLLLTVLTAFVPVLPIFGASKLVISKNIS